MRRFEFTQEEEELIYSMYYKNNIGQEAIAKKFGCSRTAIRNLFIRKGWKIRTVKEANTKYCLTEEVINNITNDYVINKIGVYSLSRKYHLSEDVIKRTLRNKGITLRNYTEAKQEGRKYSINDDYFKTQTHNMAYILGLLAADGNVSKKENQVSLSLINEDKELLEQINKELNNSRPIKEYTVSTEPQRKPMAKLQFWSKTIKDDLAIYSIVPQKTNKLKPPYFLKEEYWIDYIRGYFDGDGSVYTVGETSIGFSIVGVSKEMIEWIRKVLANKYNITNNGIYTEQNKNKQIIYKTVYYGTKLRQIYDIFYESNSLHMKRKKDKFLVLLNSKRL